MIYTYAIIEPTHAPAACTGLEGRPVEVAARGPIAAALTRHQLKPFVHPTAEGIWAHEQAIEALMRHATLLPARFGTCFQTIEQLEAVLDHNAPALSAALERVRGCVELGVRVMAEQPTREPAPPSSGRDYMMNRLESERQSHRTSELLHQSLAGHCREWVLKPQPSGPWLSSAAYLVPRDHLARFEARIRDLAAAHPRLRVLCTGPWPPYHFVPTLDRKEVELVT